MSSLPTRVLLIEDHRDLAETVVEFLESMSFDVDYAADGMTGMHLARTTEIDVIVLDINLPGVDGLTLCRSLRELHAVATPIIMMTARDELNDKLTGFESGADDYLVKPFDLPELVARIHSLVRRHRGQLAPQRFIVGDLEADTGSRVVTRGSTTLSLSPTGFTILALLMEHSPNVVSRHVIEQTLWGEEPPPSDTLRSQIYKLRKTVDKPFDHSLIQTVPGLGYRLATSDSHGLDESDGDAEG